MVVASAIWRTRMAIDSKMPKFNCLINIPKNNLIICANDINTCLNVYLIKVAARTRKK